MAKMGNFVFNYNKNDLHHRCNKVTKVTFLYYFRRVVAAKQNFTRYARQYSLLYFPFNSFEYRKIFCASSCNWYENLVL
jgi:hypothetical protein